MAHRYASAFQIKAALSSHIIPAHLLKSVSIKSFPSWHTSLPVKLRDISVCEQDTWSANKRRRHNDVDAISKKDTRLSLRDNFSLPLITHVHHCKKSTCSAEEKRKWNGDRGHRSDWFDVAACLSEKTCVPGQMTGIYTKTIHIPVCHTLNHLLVSP